MSINVYSNNDLIEMRKACKLARDTLNYLSEFAKEGVKTIDIDSMAHEYIISHGAIPATLGYNGFTKSICTSVNNVVCHGIPSDYSLKDGDIINIDVTVMLNGWHGDVSETFMVGNVSNLAKRVVAAAEQALYIGIDSIKVGGHFGDIGAAISSFADSQGFSVVRDYCGHGIGRNFHEEPQVMHYGKAGSGPEILPGMIFTVEPMLNVGSYKTKVLKDGWTAVTVDKSLSAQFEHTIAVTDGGVEILTKK